MNNIFRILLSTFLLQGGYLWAQSPDTQLHSVPPPQAPFVARAPEKSSWVIEIKPVDKGPLSQGSIPGLSQKYLKRQLWIKSGKMMKCENEWADGTRTEDWVVGRLKLCQNPQQKGIYILNPQSDAMIHDFGISDFEMLDWIGADDYIGAFPYEGEPCFLFQAKDIASGIHGAGGGAPNKTLRQLHAPTSSTKVFISVQTKLPVAIINGDGEFRFHFLAPPQDPLEMPEPFASLWKALSWHP